MAIIEMGLNFQAAQTEAELALTPTPDGTYELQVKDILLEESKKGRPRLTWKMEIINHAEFSGKKINHFTPLPHNGDLSGVGFLTAIVEALGQPWEGANLNTDEYLGLTCVANVVSDDEGKWNNIQSFA